jgi:hypothetical protein
LYTGTSFFDFTHFKYWIRKKKYENEENMRKDTSKLMRRSDCIDPFKKIRRSFPLEISIFDERLRIKDLLHSPRHYIKYQNAATAGFQQSKCPQAVRQRWRVASRLVAARATLLHAAQTRFSLGPDDSTYATLGVLARSVELGKFFVRFFQLPSDVVELLSQRVICFGC